ncbi:transcriptional regulator [Ferrovibrio terrae]|uniref:transcriptional regulator n=1 Tax=Ferrovibrio terrae TaxID=2594003 RepID=UPI003137B9AB
MSQQQESDWVATLRQAAASTSQKVAGQAIGYSASVVNQVLKGTYKGDLKAVQDAVEGKFMAMTVQCPGFGMEISKSVCATEQRRPRSFTSPIRIRVYKACRNGCAHSRVGQEKGADNAA